MLWCSSIMAILVLSADISTIAIPVVYLTIGTGKALSMKTLVTRPFDSPTISDSCLGGPETTLTNLMWSSKIHSRTKMPEKARSWIFFSNMKTRWWEVTKRLEQSIRLLIFLCALYFMSKGSSACTLYIMIFSGN